MIKKKMNILNLQTFANAVSGKKLVYLYRVLSKASSENGTMLAFTTENERTKSKDADSTATKDGTIRTPGSSESEVTATSILSEGDTIIDELEKALDEDALIEVWEVNLAENGTAENKFKAKYFQGYLTEISKSSDADGFVEVSLTFGLNGNGVDGEATVTQDQQEAAAYVFVDTVKNGA